MNGWGVLGWVLFAVAIILYCNGDEVNARDLALMDLLLMILPKK